MAEMQKLDPMTLRLRGRQVIEASAGTGKTWTLAALYLRLVLGHDPDLQDPAGQPGPALYPPQILVMTFTDAATAELRQRIRERLAQAAGWFRAEAGWGEDDFLRQLRVSFDPAHWPACAARLEHAAQWMDDAAIFTIHGWSHRMLQQHAFDSASLFRQTRVDDGERLKRIAAQDYWRHWFYPLPADRLDALERIASSPAQLLEAIGEQWRQFERSPQASIEVGDDPLTLIGRWHDWQQQAAPIEQRARELWSTHAEAVKAQLLEAMQKDLKANIYREENRAGYLELLDDWSAGGSCERKDIERFSTQKLEKSTLKNRKPPADDFGVFAALQDLADALAAEPEIKTALLAHAADQIARDYDAKKRALAQFDFSDLLQRLYHALQASDRLGAAIRARYPIALVDEFQDTDPWQYGALSRIYGDESGPESDAQQSGAGGLIMIGDPKQAIYSFRGADLDTYLRAREQADNIYTLSGNYRSTAGLVAAVNHVFGQAERPFGDIPYQPVEASNPQVQPLVVAGVTQQAMTVWRFDHDGPLKKDRFQLDSAQCCASEMVRLLNAGAARPGEMAVLVRDWQEASRIRAALSERGVRSVYLSERDSVFASREANELWRLLRAVSQPRQVGWVKAALATRLWGLEWAELEALQQDEAAWDEMLERFHGWQASWQRQGLLPMLYRLLHEQSIPRRLLSERDGERRLTNLLHLGELLQSASLQLQGEGALLRHLEDQLRDPGAGGDSAQMRLESDADLVQVITLHKSKGLQYPLVFLPFATGFRGRGEVDEAQLAEDLRLLYVGLTRAERALWLGVAHLSGDFDGKMPRIRTALSRLVGRCEPGDLAVRLQAWTSCPQIHVLAAPAPQQDRYRPPATAPVSYAPALEPRRRLARRWWMASFSALTRVLDAVPADAPALAALPGSEADDRLGDAQIDSADSGAALASPDDKETGPAAEPVHNAFPAGSAYGLLLHDLLEWQFLRGWPAQAAQPAAQGEWQALLERKARLLKLDPEQQTLLPHWIGRIATTPLPLPAAAPLTLARLQPGHAWAEMIFSLPIGRLASQRIDQLTQRHLHPGQARPALQDRQLEGMLTGSIDLVFEHEGRYYLIDYKSNRLSAYGIEQLTGSMLEHRYDVQYTLYLLALHRLLRSRLGADYDFERHLGGALYLYLRGIDQPGAGLYFQRPPRELIEALDQACAAPPAPALQEASA